VSLAIKKERHCLDLVEDLVGAFDRGNWRVNGSGSTLVRAKP
jgi:hypothetical protein